MSEKYSYSKLGVYKECPFKFKLQYIDKNYAYSANLANEYGSAIHEAEEQIAKALQAKETIDYVTIKNSLILKFIKIEQKYFKEYNSLDKSGRTYKEKAYRYLEYEIYNLEKYMKEHLTYEIIGIEQKFNFDYDENHSFNGAIDRVFHDTLTDTYIIQDIKSWPVAAEEKDLATPLQFVVYCLAAKELWGAEPNQIKCQYYLPLVDCGLVQDGGTSGFMTRGLKKINELFEHIASEDYAPNQSPLCNWCAYCKTNPDAKKEYKYLCPYFSIWDRNTRNKFDITKHENEWQGLENHSVILEAYHKKYNISQATAELL